MNDADGITENGIAGYEQRAERWALQTSTIIGTATIIAAAIGGTADATTGLPAVSALAGLLAGGLAAIFLPGRDAAPIAAGLEQLVTAIVAREAAAAKPVVVAPVVMAPVAGSVAGSVPTVPENREGARAVVVTAA